MKPILFSTQMVKAILEGRKTQTRRIIKPQPPETVMNPVHLANDVLSPSGYSFISDEFGEIPIKSKYKTEDILWVRETWVWEGETKYTDIQQIGWFFYKADFNEGEGPTKWKPSIFMPKEAARIFLEVTNVRVEKVQDISEEDAMSEGINLPNYAEQAIKDVKYPEPSEIFMELWDSINGKKYPWSSNPWVFVYEFKKIEK